MAASDRFHAIIPLKTRASAKSRLSPGFGRMQRIDLIAQMLHGVLGACAEARLVDRMTIVVDGPFPDTGALPAATRLVRQPATTSGLSAGVAATLDLLAPESSGGVAIVMADLPAITAPSLDRALAQVGPGRAGLIATDQHSEGTSLLAWRGGMFRDLRYGAGSRTAHRVALRAAGFGVRELPPHPAFCDLDTPADAGIAIRSPAFTT